MITSTKLMLNIPVMSSSCYSPNPKEHKTSHWCILLAAQAFNITTICIIQPCAVACQNSSTAEQLFQRTHNWYQHVAESCTLFKDVARAMHRQSFSMKITWAIILLVHTSSVRDQGGDPKSLYLEVSVTEIKRAYFQGNSFRTWKQDSL